MVEYNLSWLAMQVKNLQGQVTESHHGFSPPVSNSAKSTSD